MRSSVPRHIQEQFNAQSELYERKIQRLECQSRSPFLRHWQTWVSFCQNLWALLTRFTRRSLERGNDVRSRKPSQKYTQATNCAERRIPHHGHDLSISYWPHHCCCTKSSTCFHEAMAPRMGSSQPDWYDNYSWWSYTCFPYRLYRYVPIDFHR